MTLLSFKLHWGCIEIKSHYQVLFCFWFDWLQLHHLNMLSSSAKLKISTTSSFFYAQAPHICIAAVDGNTHFNSDYCFIIPYTF